MRWRWIPPVVSPISPGSLVVGGAAVLGLIRARRDGLRRALAERFSAKDVVLTDSGTSALVLALRAVERRTGFVAFPAYACVDLIAAAVRARIGIRLYDVNPRTLSPDLDSLRAACTRGVDAVLVAPLFGYPVDHPRVVALAGEHGLTVIEDAAQGAAGDLHGRRIGSFGAVTVLSFGRGKGTTGGSGGALLVRDSDWAARLRDAPVSLRPAHRGARDVVGLAAQWALARPSLYTIPASIPALRLGETVYHEAMEPREMSAAASRVVPRAISADASAVRARRDRAATLLAANARGKRLTGINHVDGGVPGYLRLPLLDAGPFGEPVSRLGVLRGYPMTLDEDEHALQLLAPGERAGQGARELRDRLVTLPTHARCGPKDVRRLEQWLETGKASLE